MRIVIVIYYECSLILLSCDATDSARIVLRLKYRFLILLSIASDTTMKDPALATYIVVSIGCSLIFVIVI